MIRITHPRPQAGRQAAFGVSFVDGVATVEELHPMRELALKQHGFTILEEIEGVKLEDLTKAALLDIAETENIDIPAKATKAEIIEALTTAPSIPVIGADDLAPED